MSKRTPSPTPEDRNDTTSAKRAKSALPMDSIVALLENDVRLTQVTTALGLELEATARMVIASSMKLASKTPPHHLLCPITHELFLDPVVAADGFSYERAAIEQHFKTKGTSPTTNLSIARSVLPNCMAKSQATEWVEDRAIFAPLALQHLVDGDQVEEAARLVEECSSWIKRFPPKLRLAFLEKSLRLPCHNTPFITRQNAYISAAMETGIKKTDALLKAHALGAGYYHYGTGSDEMATLVQATCSLQTFELEFSLGKANEAYKLNDELTSDDFSIAGVGACYMVLKRIESGWGSYTHLREPVPAVDLKPVIISLNRIGTDTQYSWRESGRSPNGYGGEVAELSEPPCVIRVRLVVRDTDRSVVRVVRTSPEESSVADANVDS